MKTTNRCLGILFFILALSANFSEGQNIQFLGNINPTSASDPGQAYELNDRFVFTADTLSGRELLVSDGTISYTYLLADINPGVGSSSPNIFGKIGNKIIFGALGPSGFELYATDGTPSGTVLVSDIYPGVSSSNPTYIFTLGDKMYFAATTAGGDGIFYTDGTTSGTGFLKSLTASNRINAHSGIGESITYNNRAYFVISTPETGTELGESDGTADGTRITTNLRSGPVDGICNYNLRRAGSKILFCSNTVAGIRIEAKDTSTDSVTFVYANPTEFSDLRLLGSTGSKVFFLGFTDQYRLYVTDGTSAGTVRLTGADLPSGEINSSPYTSSFNYTIYNNQLIFLGTTPTTGAEPFISGGTPQSTALIKDINPGTESSALTHTKIINFGDTTYLNLRTASTGAELFKTDGTLAGTDIVEDLAPGTLTFDPLIRETALNKLWLNGDASGGTDYEFYYYSDLCAYNPAKTAPGQCGCNVSERDLNGDGISGCGEIRYQISLIKSELAPLNYPRNSSLVAGFKASRTAVRAKISELVRYLKLNRSTIQMKRRKKLSPLIKTLESRSKSYGKAKRSSDKSAKKNLQKALNKILSDIASTTQ